MTRKIYTAADARDERVLADIKMQAKRRRVALWIVIDLNGNVLGRCHSRATAEKFIRDSIHTHGWTVHKVYA